MNREALLAATDEAMAEAAVSPALDAMRADLEKRLPALLEKARDAGAEVTVEGFGMRAAKRPEKPVKSTVKITMRFDARDKHAEKWVEEHATELIENVSRVTRERLREAIGFAFEEGRSVKELTDVVLGIIKDENRADLIARTETIAAANAGQQEAWRQATEQGFLSGDEKQVWIVTPDDRLCEICEPMDGVTADLNGEFDLGFEWVSGPPAHPRCRCTIGLA